MLKKREEGPYSKFVKVKGKIKKAKIIAIFLFAFSLLLFAIKPGIPTFFMLLLGVVAAAFTFLKARALEKIGEELGFA